MKIFNLLFYWYLLIFNVWRECNEPRWIKRDRVDSSTLYIYGKTFQYKIIALEWGQGGEVTQCYRRYRKYILKKKSGLY